MPLLCFALVSVMPYVALISCHPAVHVYHVIVYAAYLFCHTATLHSHIVVRFGHSVP